MDVSRMNMPCSAAENLQINSIQPKERLQQFAHKIAAGCTPSWCEQIKQGISAQFHPLPDGIDGTHAGASGWQRFCRGEPART
jgi:hypothetical protein